MPKTKPVKKSVQPCPYPKRIDGGRHRHTKENGKQHGTESHHIIANAISDLNYRDAPAIRMNKQDHLKTGSHGSQGNKGREWRKKQQELVKKKKYDEALQMGIKDITVKFPGKYDAPIKAMKDSLPKKPGGGFDWSKVNKK